MVTSIVYKMGVVIDYNLNLSHNPIAIGRIELVNGLMFWNPTTNSISISADYRLDPIGHLPSPCNIEFDGPL
jgi:hypothetical protein